jgi:hypothetical protein
MTKLSKATLIGLSLLLEPRPLVVTREDGRVNVYHYTVTYRGAALLPLLEQQAALLQ